MTSRRPLTVNDIAKEIVRYNHHVPITEIEGAEIVRIALSLHHTHIPKSVAAGIVEYDRERRLVTPTDAIEQLSPYLSAIIDADPALEISVER